VTEKARSPSVVRRVVGMPLHPKTPSSLASFKSRLVLPFWNVRQSETDVLPLCHATIYMVPKSEINSRVHYAAEPAWGQCLMTAECSSCQYFDCVCGIVLCLQYFDTVGWVAGRVSGLSGKSR